MEKHQQNIELYLSYGGDPKLAQRFKSSTLENRAKVKYLLSQISQSSVEIIKSQDKTSCSDHKNEDEPTVDPPKPKFLGLITQYPIELHSAYNEAFSLWLELCSLKAQLNVIAPEDESAAYDIQTNMLRKIQKFDRNKKSLDHYQNFKAVMSTESKRDFSKMTELELDRERRNLASNISKRRKTIAKKESELPEESSPDYHKRLDALNRKKEELEELILDEEKIQELNDHK